MGCQRKAGDEEKLKVSKCGVRGVRGAGVGRDLRPDQPLSTYQQFRGHTHHGAKVHELKISGFPENYSNQCILLFLGIVKSGARKSFY